MNEFNKKTVSIQENLIEKLREQYTSTLKEHQKYLSKKLSKLFPEHSNIEKIIDKQFIPEIKYNGIFTINELSEDLEELSKSMTKESYDKEPDKQQLFSLYIHMLKEKIQRNQMTWIDNVIEDFTNDLININKESSNSPEDDKKIIKDIMEEYKRKLIKEYNEIQKEFVNSIISQISSLINKTDFIKIRTSEYENFSKLLILSNYELIEEDRIFYAKNKTTGEQTELYLENGVLNSKDRKLQFVIDKDTKTQGFINNETNQRIVIKKEEGLQKINLISLKDNTLITISKYEENYSFEKNLKYTTNIKEIKSILIEIQNNYPGIFNKLIHDRDLKPIVEKIIAYNKKVAEIIQKRKSENENSLSSNESNIKKLTDEPKKKP